MVWFKYVRFLVSKWRPVYIRTSQVQLPRRTIWPTFRAIRHLRQCGANKWHVFGTRRRGHCDPRGFVQQAVAQLPRRAKPRLRPACTSNSEAKTPSSPGTRPSDRRLYIPSATRHNVENTGREVLEYV